MVLGHGERPRVYRADREPGARERDEQKHQAVVGQPATGQISTGSFLGGLVFGRRTWNRQAAGDDGRGESGSGVRPGQRQGRQVAELSRAAGGCTTILPWRSMRRPSTGYAIAEDSRNRALSSLPMAIPWPLAVAHKRMLTRAMPLGSRTTLSKD